VVEICLLPFGIITLLMNISLYFISIPAMILSYGGGDTNVGTL